nr:MAG TPA: hypothetical protein [Caudoviricetes sp.]
MEKSIFRYYIRIVRLRKQTTKQKTNNRNKSENKINVESAKRKSKELSKVQIVH